jgi:hypothetical protein
LFKFYYGGDIVNLGDFGNAALFEHRFWLQIMGDHGRFILNSLPTEEDREIIKSGELINAFDQMLYSMLQVLRTILMVWKKSS